VDTVRGEFAHWYPEALPGGRVVLFNSYASPIENSFIEAVDLSSGKRTVLVKGAIFPRYSTSGHLLFARGAAIFAVRFDPRALRVLGPEVPVVEDLAWSVTDGVAAFAVSANGTLAYLRGSEATRSRRVMWSDRAGNLRPAVPDTAGWSEPRLSPDGRWIALTLNEPQREIWLYDNTRRVLSQLTRNPLGVSFSPVWLPDSRSLLHAREVPQYDIFRQPLDGAEPTTVFTSRTDQVPLSVAADGQTVALLRVSGKPEIRIGRLRDGSTQLLGSSDVGHNTASLSPDGRWLAYSEYSAEQKPNVFVRLVAGGDGRRSVSADGGDQPIFTRGGREIVYRKGDAMLAASFNPSTGEVGTPSLLFRVTDAGRLWGGRTIGYDVSADGSRFLLVVPVERPGATPNVVVLNWASELNRRVPR
jgi:dipeptidyl aminopeptidase/acylaminoacyl peptidase